MNDTIKNQPSVVWQTGQVSHESRCTLTNAAPKTIWFTGLSGAGKTTLAFALESALFERKKPCYVLDGDNIRHGLCKDLGFSIADRSENIRRVAEVCKLMNQAGLHVIAAFISPLHADRELAKTIIGETAFFEVYLNTPLDACESRDPKGLYKKARLGQIKNFTGIDSSYEQPKHPNITLNTSNLSIRDCISQLTLALSI